jgi:ribonuclease VapC
LTIFVDASAMISMMAGESDADELADRLGAQRLRLCSAVSVWETVAGLCRTYMFRFRRPEPKCKVSSS